MSRYVLLFIFLIGVMCSKSVFAENQHRFSLQQEKQKYIVIAIDKFENNQIEQLLTELRSYSGKIASADFNFTTRQLTIYYTNAVALNDIFQVVEKHVTDFSKIAGSEL